VLGVLMLPLPTICLLDFGNIFCYHFIIHLPDQPDVRIESTDTTAISAGQTLTLKCSFDFGTGLVNVKWIHTNNIEIKGFHTIDSKGS
jgi:hypothetical protein